MHTSGETLRHPRERCFLGDVLDNDLAKLMEKQDRRVAIDAHQLRSSSHWNARHKLDYQSFLITWKQPASTPELIHLTKIAFFSYLCQPLNLFDRQYRASMLHTHYQFRWHIR